MKSYRIIQIVEETYYIEAENEDDAIDIMHSGEVEPRKIHDGDVTVVEEYIA